MLADATRVRIVLALRKAGELPVNLLAETVEKTPAAVSQHLAKLRLGRMVQTRREGTTVFYRLANEHASELVMDAIKQAEHSSGARTAPPRAGRPRDEATQSTTSTSTPRHGHDEHSHDHEHPHGGLRGFLYDLFVPHSHDSADSIDDAMEASTAGVRALKISLVILLATTVLQAALVALTGSVALLADTIHNFADALTAVPLWIAFVLGRRVASRRYTYGYGRAEDLAGMFIVLVVALSAVVAGVGGVARLLDPRPIENPWLLVLAGVIGFAGNEIVAIYRIRVGRRIGSAALVADGVHARLDGVTSLSVVLGAIGVLLGFPLADPIIGLLIAVSILVLLWGTVKSVGARLMDAIAPTSSSAPSTPWSTRTGSPGSGV